MKLVAQAGQSLVEVLVVTVIVATVLTALAAGLTMSVKNTSQSKQRSLATSLAQEGLEAFHRERYELGWTEFYDAVSSSTYCLVELPTDLRDLTASECISGETIEGTNFVREAVVTVGAEDVAVVITVTWHDGEDEKSVSLEQTFQDI